MASANAAFNLSERYKGALAPECVDAFSVQHHRI